MSAVSARILAWMNLRWRKSQFLLLIAVVVLAGVSPRVSAGQDTSSIVGSQPLPGLKGAVAWINSAPLTAQQLKGKVVLVDFWDYSCINCIRAVPYIRAWAEKYKDSGLVVIGVHSPEFDVEKELANVQRAVKKFNITYPVAVDSDLKVWNAFHNQYWPAHYFIDAKGKVRYEHFGEGGYEESEKQIQQLLKEARPTAAAKSMAAASVHGQGVEAAADVNDVRSPETYVGYARAAHFRSTGGIKRDQEQQYAEPAQLKLNEWGLSGKWNDHLQVAVLGAAGGKIIFRFHARDLHMVLGPGADGKPVRFRVTIDGQAPGANHGVDTDAGGNGVVKEHRLYQLVRQAGAVGDHTFAIEFLDAGVQAFSFTFG